MIKPDKNTHTPLGSPLPLSTFRHLYAPSTKTIEDIPGL